jgi:hypothetical protein
MLLIVMGTSDLEGWTISEYKTFKVSGDDTESSSEDGSSSEDENEQIFTKSKIIRRKQYKRIHEEELLPE